MKYYKTDKNQIFSYDGDDSQYDFIGNGLIEISEQEAKTIEDEQLAAIENEVPTEISRFQMLAFLRVTMYAGRTMYDWINDYVNDLDDKSDENIILKTAWETSSEFSRTSFPVMTAQRLFNLTDEQGDEMFLAASKMTMPNTTVESTATGE